tara:strand:- start:3341 stop:3862 length:522 start_codon:yes stop_codon:yes gene_type:complete
MLLKGYNEVKNSFDQNIALEMLFIKLCYSSQLPSIDSLISDLKATVPMDSKKIQNIISEQTDEPAELVNVPETFDEIKSLLIDNDIRLADEIDKLDLIEYKIGHIELTSNEEFDNQLISNMQSALRNLTNMDWIINISGNNTKEQNQVTISSIKEHFPDAEIVNEDEKIQDGG